MNEFRLAWTYHHLGPPYHKKLFKENLNTHYFTERDYYTTYGRIVEFSRRLPKTAVLRQPHSLVTALPVFNSS